MILEVEVFFLFYFRKEGYYLFPHIRVTEPGRSVASSCPRLLPNSLASCQIRLLVLCGHVMSFIRCMLMLLTHIILYVQQIKPMGGKCALFMDLGNSALFALDN